MAEMFFECCVQCARTFTDRDAYEEHMKAHRGEAKKKAETEKKVQAEEYAKVPGEEFSQEKLDEQLNEVKEITKKRKAMIRWGVEAATMTPQEVEARYKSETVKRAAAKKASAANDAAE